MSAFGPGNAGVPPAGFSHHSRPDGGVPRRPLRPGFTLVEVLVSVGIFAVVSVAMALVFTQSARLYRSAETARLANDEAVAVVATLDDDLKRIIPAADGGFFYCGYHAPGGIEPAGNTILAFTIKNPDPGAVDAEGKGAHQLVAWWCSADGQLYRAVTAANENRGTGSPDDFAILSGLYDPTKAALITRGCLLFSASTCSDEALRKDMGDWTQDLAGQPTRPNATIDDFICTLASAGHSPPDPFPAAIRLTLVLAGGGNAGSSFTASTKAAQGFVVEDQDDRIRTGGLGTLPTGPNSLVRLGNPQTVPTAMPTVEWIGYETFASGVLEADGGLHRGLFRTTKLTHPRGTPVRLGRVYSIARIMPR